MIWCLEPFHKGSNRSLPWIFLHSFYRRNISSTYWCFYKSDGCFAWPLIFLFSVNAISNKFLVPVWKIIWVRWFPAYTWSFMNPNWYQTYRLLYKTLGSICRWYIYVISKLSWWLSYIIKYAFWLYYILSQSWMCAKASIFGYSNVEQNPTSNTVSTAIPQT